MLDKHLLLSVSVMLAVWVKGYEHTAARVITKAALLEHRPISGSCAMIFLTLETGGYVKWWLLGASRQTYGEAGSGLWAPFEEE